MTMALSQPKYAHETGWRAIDALLPEAIRLDPSHTPTEEWLTVGPALVFVPVPEGKTIKNRLHLDLAPHITDDRNALIDSLLARGASRVNIGQNEAAASWTVLADPEGNEFCVLSARDN